MAKAKFKKIPKNTFDTIELEAGVLLKNFDIDTKTYQDEDIICATTGGIKIDAVPTYSDLGEDVDNCPPNMKELKHLDSWAVTVGFASLGTSPELIAMALGCATINGNKITPNADLNQSDFKSIWWVGDKANGGCVAAKILNALSTGGLSMQTTKNGKGNIAITLTGHVSIEAQDIVPIEFYSADPEPSTSGGDTGGQSAEEVA